jgi:hypothetical protein
LEATCADGGDANYGELHFSLLRETSLPPFKLLEERREVQMSGALHLTSGAFIATTRPPSQPVLEVPESEHHLPHIDLDLLECIASDTLSVQDVWRRGKPPRAYA